MSPLIANPSLSSRHVLKGSACSPSMTASSLPITTLDGYEHRKVFVLLVPNVPLCFPKSPKSALGHRELPEPLPYLWGQKEVK